jgi:2-polyprenyl-3-methyl-5-hydroxy-6-metoxy-1,4-benzoquinol methylase
VCDAGCGNGRFTYGLCKLGAEVVALDISPAGVEATIESCKGVAKVNGLQWDLLVPKPDFQEQFDLVFSFGVLHHTGNTRKALENIATWVVPGGYLFIMIYNHKPRSSARRHAFYRTLLRPFPLSWRPSILRLIGPHRFGLLAMNLTKEQRKALTKEDRELLIHSQFDAFSPSINDTHSAEEVRSWLKELRFTDIRDTQPLEHNHVVVARKPHV